MKQLLLSALVLLFSTSLFAQSYSGGSGTSADPYQIANKTDLKYLSEHSGEWTKSFKQTADITFTTSDFENGGDFYNSGSGFIPIGTDYTTNNNFTGTYDGNNHTVTGLKINNTSNTNSNIGMFGYIKNASISNLGVINVNFIGGGSVGGLVGYNSYSSISQCYSTGTVSSSYYSSTSYSGGLVAYNVGSITKCYSTATVSVTSSGGNVYAGGLVGFNGGATIENCYATGNSSSSTSNSTSSSHAGGLIGRNSSTSGTVTNCYATGQPTATGGATQYKGGLLGRHSYGSYSHCYYDTETTGMSVPYSGGSDVTNVIEGKSTAAMKTQSTYVSWDFSTVWKITGTAYPTFATITTAIFPIVNNNSFVVYPNPVIGVLNVQSDKAVKSLIVYSLDGKAVVKKSEINNNSLDLNNLQKGNYILKVIFEDNSFSSANLMKD